MIDQIRKLMAPLQRRIFLMIARGIIKNVDDSTTIQQLQISLLSDEVIDKMERIQEYGFSSNPKIGAEAVAAFLGGNRDHGVIIAVDDRRYRKKNLVSGEVCLYTDEGDFIWFRRNGKMEIQTSAEVKVTAPEVKVVASTKVTITSPNVEITGNLEVDGNIDSEGNITCDGNIVADGNITGTNITATAAVAGVSVTASGAVAGATVAAGGVGIASIKTAFNSHTHAETGTTTATPAPTIP